MSTAVVVLASTKTGKCKTTARVVAFEQLDGALRCNEATRGCETGENPICVRRKSYMEEYSAHAQLRCVVV